MPAVLQCAAVPRPVIQVTEKRSPYSYLRREVPEQHVGALRLRVGKEHPPRVEVPVPVTATVDTVSVALPMPKIVTASAVLEQIAITGQINKCASGHAMTSSMAFGTKSDQILH